MKTFRQILAIARIEVRFGFRRGAPVVTTILIGLIFGAGILLGPLVNLPLARDEMNQMLQNPATVAKLEQNGLTTQEYRQIAAEGMAQMAVIGIPMAWQILLITTFLFLPVAASTSIPADSKFGAAELLHSLPVSGEIYIAGKALGFGATVTLVALVPFGLFLAVFEGALRAYLQVDIPVEIVWFYVKFALLGWLPMVAWAIMIGLLAGTPFRTRRAAAFPGLAAGILSIFLWQAVFKAPTLPFSQLDLTSYYLIQNYHSTALDALYKASGVAPFPLLGEGAPLLGLGRVIGMDILLVVGLFILALLTRLWLYWKENF